MRRRVAYPAAALSLLLVLTGCIPDAPTPPTPGESGGLAWEDCFDEAREENPDLGRDKTVECAKVAVPADWNAPEDGESFEIAVMRIYTGDLEDKRGSVLTNPGGPGASGLRFLPYFVEPPAVSGQLPPSSLLEEFALVSFDPRGVGESEPVDCISDADLEASFGYDPDPISDEAFDGAVEIYQRIGDGCGAKYGDDLRLFSTVQAVKDMDAIRAAVGDEKLTYLGFSYGTLLGAVYAQLFPGNVRALALDGAVNPQDDLIEGSEGQAMGFERALSNFAEWCQENQAECPISDNPRGAIAAEIERGRVSPVAGPDGRQATAGWVLWGVTLSLYAEFYWQYLGPAIDDLSRGDAFLIFALADTYAERDEQGNYDNQHDAFHAIGCADSEAPSLEEVRELQAQWRDEYPMFGASLATGLLPCALWPAERDPYPTGPYTGEPPLVVVGTLGDPATPYESTQDLADMLGNSVVVTWEGEGHTAYGETSCIQRAVDNYLIDLVAPEDGLTCPAS